MNEMKDFKLQAFLDVANELVRADEVKRALWVLDNLPAYYRDHEPIQVTDLRDKILKKICTPSSYAINNWDLHMQNDMHLRMEQSLRGKLIVNDVKYCNKHGFTPHVIDYGPGEYWLPRLLKAKDLQFSYQPIFLHEAAYKIAHEMLKDVLRDVPGNGPTIFVACEIIEHLWNTEDLRIEMLKTCGLADIVHVSTPLYTFDFNCADWDKEKEDLGHLYAFTPREFQDLVEGMFKEYTSVYYSSQIQHIRGVRKNAHASLLETATSNMFEMVL